MDCIILNGSISDQSQLIELIKQMPQLRLRSSCLTPGDAINKIQAENIDLIFIDTKLASIPGIEFAKSLINRPMLIFTSSDVSSAADAFNIDAVDYLVKPLKLERFMQAVQKANEIFELRKIRSDNFKIIDQPVINSYDNFILTKTDNGITKINVDEILYIEGLKDYIKIFTTKNIKPYIVRNSLKKFANVLPSSRFSRVHKSFIISIEHISSISKTQVFIANTRIPLGESYKNFFLTRLQENMVV